MSAAVCNHWKTKGVCNPPAGKTCHFSHPEDQKATTPSPSSSQVCNHWKTKGVCNPPAGKTCHFSHPEDQKPKTCDDCGQLKAESGKYLVCKGEEDHLTCKFCGKVYHRRSPRHGGKSDGVCSFNCLENLSALNGCRVHSRFSLGIVCHGPSVAFIDKEKPCYRDNKWCCPTCFHDKTGFYSCLCGNGCLTKDKPCGCTINAAAFLCREL